MKLKRIVMEQELNEIYQGIETVFSILNSRLDEDISSDCIMVGKSAPEDFNKSDSELAELIIRIKTGKYNETSKTGQTFKDLFPNHDACFKSLVQKFSGISVGVSAKKTDCPAVPNCNALIDNSEDQKQLASIIKTISTTTAKMGPLPKKGADIAIQVFTDTLKKNNPTPVITNTK